MPYCVEFASLEYVGGGSLALCPFPGCKHKLVVKCPVDPLTGRIRLLDDDGDGQWVGRDAPTLANHFQAPLTGHGREGVQLLLDAGIEMGQAGRRAGLTGEAALKPRKSTGPRGGRASYKFPDIVHKPEVREHARRLAADRRLTSMPVERAFTGSQAFGKGARRGAASTR